jgi:excisionase family DNA binding protein
MTKATTNETTWTVEDVSAYLRIPVGTLYQWRHRGVGPRASKVGRHLRYQPSDVRVWLATLCRWALDS